MSQFVILFAVIAAVFAEPPSNYAAPQFYSAPTVSYAPAVAYAPTISYAPAAAYYDGGSDGSEHVSDELLARVAQILEQSEGGYTGGISSGYGAPSGGGILLGRPERAQRVAEFDLAPSYRGYSGGYATGGY